MKKTIPTKSFFVFVPLIFFSMACGGVSIFHARPIPPSPSTNNVQTESSPLSGDWNADTEFGKLAFTVDPNGTMVTTAVIQVHDWTCGGTTLSAGIQSISHWRISNNEFIGDVNLSDTFHTLKIVGIYDELNKKFSGTWEENSHGTLCSNTWETLAREYR